MMDPDRAKEVRRAVLEFLAVRHHLAYDPASILKRVRDSRVLDFEPTLEEVEGALSFLRSSGWTGSIPSKIGKDIFHQATSAGVLAHEQGYL